MSFSMNLRRLMDRANMKAPALAEALGVKPPAVYQWLAGETRPATMRLQPIASALGATVQELMDGPITADGPLKPPSAEVSRTHKRLSIFGMIRQQIGGAPKAETPDELDQKRFRLKPVGGVKIFIDEEIQPITIAFEIDAWPSPENPENTPVYDDEYRSKIEWILPKAMFDGRVSHPDNLLILNVEGESMSPELSAGEKVVFDAGQTLPSPDGLYIIWDGFRLTARRLELLPASKPWRVRVVSANPRYAPYEADLEDINIAGRILAKWTWL